MSQNNSPTNNQFDNQNDKTSKYKTILGYPDPKPSYIPWGETLILAHLFKENIDPNSSKI